MRISPRPRRKLQLSTFAVPVIALEGSDVQLTYMIDATWVPSVPSSRGSTGSPGPHGSIGASDIPGAAAVIAVTSWGPWRVVGMATGSLVLAALLNAEHLLDRAQKKPFGGERDIWVQVWTPLDEVSDTLFLNRPRRWLDQLTGRELSKPVASVAGTSGVLTTDGPASPVAPLAAGPVQLRTPTANQPLKLWVGGDSMAIQFGNSLSRLASQTGLIAPELDARASTGLTRPDFFDWQAELRRVVVREAPEVMVLVFGANDAQGLRAIDGEIYQPGSDGWRTEYRLRVGLAMDAVRDTGRLVIWLGQPVMRDDEFSQSMAELNAIFREEASQRAGVRYFDSWQLFLDDRGRYSETLTTPGGDIQEIRDADGVHLTRSGADLLATRVLESLHAEVPALATTPP